MTGPNPITDAVRDAFIEAQLTMEAENALRENPAEAARRLVVLALILTNATPLQIALAQTLAIQLLEFLAVPGAKALVKAAFRQCAADEESSDPTPTTPPPDPDALLTEGRTILDAPDQLALVRAQLQRDGYAGETAPVELLYVEFGSRLLERPVNMGVEGTSSVGKTYAVERAAAFHPPEAIHNLTGMSERAILYSDRETRHVYIVIGEAAALHKDGVGASVIRSLAWGNRLVYDTVEKGDDGKLVARVIEKPGPTGMVTTSTKPLDPELATRLLRIVITDDPDQTKKIIAAQAKHAAHGTAAAPTFAPWHAAQRWLTLVGERHIVIPFAEALGQRVPCDDVRMRRDFQQILGVVQAHALLHQRQRERDAQGQILADRRDYEAAYRLLRDVLAITLDNVSKTMRETVEAVLELKISTGVGYAELSAALDRSKATVAERVQRAIHAGYLANAEQRKGYPAKIVIADPIPEPRSILPAPDELFASSSPPPANSAKQPYTAPELPRRLGDGTVRPSEREPEVYGRTVPPPVHPAVQSQAPPSEAVSGDCTGVRPDSQEKEEESVEDHEDGASPSDDEAPGETWA